MIFGEIPVGEAAGAHLAHSVRHANGTYKKGRLLTPDDIAALRSSGITKVFAARLGPDDVPEDEAASLIARAIAGKGVEAQEPFTGRANLHSNAHGLAVIDAARVKAVNRLHESLTIATATPFEQVEDRQLVATVKVIPFAVPRGVVEEAFKIAEGPSLVSVSAFKPKRAGLIITKLPHMKPALIEKSEAAIRERLSALGADLARTVVCDHAITAVAMAITGLKQTCDPVLVFGASAIVDRGDVIPSAVVAAGGAVVHLGMPVDPGNLMMLGRIAETAVLGVPSCARSPKLNGFDWVLQRVMADIAVDAHDIMDMGAGGLLKEIPTRPTPRERAKPQKAPDIAVLILAAGLSSRMQGRNKLLIAFDGEPMVRKVARAALASQAQSVTVVTGHDAEAVTAALEGLDVRLVHNPDFATGIASSVKRGIAALGEAGDGAVIALGDMPLIAARDIDRLIAAFNPSEHRAICVPVAAGRRGNPVLIGRQFFPELLALTGDQGARRLIDRHTEDVVEVIAGEAALTDFDTPESLGEG